TPAAPPPRRGVPIAAAVIAAPLMVAVSFGLGAWWSRAPEPALETAKVAAPAPRQAEPEPEPQPVAAPVPPEPSPAAEALRAAPVEAPRPAAAEPAAPRPAAHEARAT